MPACPQIELTRWLGAAAVKRDLTDKMRDAQKKAVRAHHILARSMHGSDELQICLRWKKRSSL